MYSLNFHPQLLSLGSNFNGHQWPIMDWLLLHAILDISCVDSNGFISTPLLITFKLCLISERFSSPSKHSPLRLIRWNGTVGDSTIYFRVYKNSMFVHLLSTFRDFVTGSVLSGGGSKPFDNVTSSDWADMVDGLQKGALEIRLGIPIYGSDAVHGNNNVYGTMIFPHNVGLGATRDPDLVERIGVGCFRDQG